MFREIATIIIVFFLATVVTLTFPAVEDVGDTVETNDAVKELGMDGIVANTEAILFKWAMLVLLGGICLWAAIRLVRKESVRGRRGLR